MARTTPVQFNGPAILVAMFRELPPHFHQTLLEKLAKESPILAKLVTRCEFIYSDIARLESKSIQKVLTLFPDKDWLLAWKLSSEDLRARLLENMSERKRSDFILATKTQPKAPRKQVVLVQARISAKVYDMLTKGQLRMTSKDGWYRQKLMKRAEAGTTKTKSA